MTRKKREMFDPTSCIGGGPLRPAVLMLQKALKCFSWYRFFSVVFIVSSLIQSQTRYYIKRIDSFHDAVWQDGAAAFGRSYRRSHAAAGAGAVAAAAAAAGRKCLSSPHHFLWIFTYIFISRQASACSVAAPYPFTAASELLPPLLLLVLQEPHASRAAISSSQVL